MSWIKTGLVCLSSLLLLGFLDDPLTAQELPPVQIHGRVVDNQTEDPIPGATVFLSDSYGVQLARRVTDDDGAFTFEVRHRAAARLRSARIGYREATTPLLQFDGRHFFSVVIRLDVDAVLLAPLEIVARSAPRRSAVFSDFDFRVRRGMGSYVTRDEIQRLQPSFVTDLLARFPGVHLEGSGRGSQRIVSMGRASLGPGGGGCPVQIFLDGNLVNPRSGAAVQAGQFDANVYIDELVVPSVVEGIEVYRGTSTIPADFMNPNSRCGVVAIWTRRGG